MAARVGGIRAARPRCHEQIVLYPPYLAFRLSRFLLRLKGRLSADYGAKHLDK